MGERYSYHFGLQERRGGLAGRPKFLDPCDDIGRVLIYACTTTDDP